jgi:non-ribosomal peptide synthase protein (TIGR01720 family)
LTQNGKVDKKSLPVPNLSLRQVGSEYVAPVSEVEKALVSIWSEVLGIDTVKIGVHDNFFGLGGDSIVSIQLIARARNTGIHFTVKDIFSSPTVAKLALALRSNKEGYTSGLVSIKPFQEEVIGDIPLTPIQSWFFEKNLSNKNHYNQAFMLLVDLNSINPLFLKKSIEFILLHHDALRCKYERVNGNTHINWKQINLGSSQESISSVWSEIDLSSIADEELASVINNYSTNLQTSLNIEIGTLVKAALLNCGTYRPARLLIVIHHLVVDGVSWRILFEDLESSYKSLEKGCSIPSIPKTHSYQQWSNALLEYAKSGVIKEQVPYWTEIEEGAKRVMLPKDFDEEAKRNSNASGYKDICVSLSEEETQSLLQRVPKAYRTEINDILLTALALAIGDWTGKYEVSLSLEGHGREDIGLGIDTSRTIGWFTTVFPVYLNVSSASKRYNENNTSTSDIDLGEAIKTVKEELRRIPNKGIGYGVLSYLSGDSNKEDKTISHFRPSISFNYLGQWDNTLQKECAFTFASEFCGESVSKENKDSYILNINSEIRRGSFGVSFSYSGACYRRQTIENIGGFFIERLKQIIKHCTSEGVHGYTISDFKAIDLSPNKLSKRIRTIEEAQK